MARFGDVRTLSVRQVGNSKYLLFSPEFREYLGLKEDEDELVLKFDVAHKGHKFIGLGKPIKPTETKEEVIAYKRAQLRALVTHGIDLCNSLAHQPEERELVFGKKRNFNDFVTVMHHLEAV